MSLPLTATDQDGNKITVTWRHQANTVLIKIEQPRVGRIEGYWADVELTPEDALAIARHLSSAASAVLLSIGRGDT